MPGSQVSKIESIVALAFMNRHSPTQSERKLGINTRHTASIQLWAKIVLNLPHFALRNVKTFPSSIFKLNFFSIKIHYSTYGAIAGGLNVTMT